MVLISNEFLILISIIAIIVKIQWYYLDIAAANINEKGTKIAINNGSNERNKILRGVKNEIYSLAFSHNNNQGQIRD